MLQTELAKKEKLVDDLLLQQDTSTQYPMGGGSTKNAAGGISVNQKLKLDSHLASNLKRKIREL
jgi:hypothetical protein